MNKHLFPYTETTRAHDNARKDHGSIRHTHPHAHSRFGPFHLFSLALVFSTFSFVLIPARVTHADSPVVHVAVVKSLDLPEYNEAQEGFFAELSRSGRRPHAVHYTLTRNSAANDAIWTSIQKSEPDLILALGSKAAREAGDYEKDIPVVYAMVLTIPDDLSNNSELSGYDNLTGATLNIPLETQIAEIKHVFPTARSLGTICDSSHTLSMVQQARRLAELHDLQIHVAWVNNESEVPDAVRRLRDSTDVFWMLPDQTVMTPRSSRFIIFEMIKAGTPVVGLSSAYVKAGAVLALECRYDDIGRQSGELAIRILNGQSPQGIPETSPRAFRRTLNLKVREHLKIPIDEAIIEDSNVVIP